MSGKQLNGHVENHSRMDKQKILFIRHGESEAHVGKAAHHIEEVRLTPIGAEKAKNIADLLPRAPDLIIASPYLRAWETAIPTRQRFPDIPYETWPEVQEFTYLGSLSGQCKTKQERSGYVNAYWAYGKPDHRDGNGETFEEFIGRAWEVLQRLRQIDGFVVVFTHEQFIRAVQSVLEGWMGDKIEHMPMRRFREVLLTDPLPYGCIMELFAYPDSWQRAGTLLESRLRSAFDFSNSNLNNVSRILR